jgi:hypothetical protein
LVNLNPWFQTLALFVESAATLSTAAVFSVSFRHLPCALDFENFLPFSHFAVGNLAHRARLIAHLDARPANGAVAAPEGFRFDRSNFDRLILTDLRFRQGNLWRIPESRSYGAMNEDSV